MLGLPFDKWTLNFYNSEYEVSYEEHVNEFRAQCFRLINLLLFFAIFICMIVFIIQQQPFYLVIVSAIVCGGCLMLSLFVNKVKPYLRLVFPVLHLFGTFSHVIMKLSDIQIPDYVFGYSVGCVTMGVIQYCDNRIKLIYVITTPFVLLGIYDVYSINTLQFVIHAFSCMIFVGTLAYMNEYTSRLAFSLHIMVDKYKEIIFEFLNDSMFLISLDPKTGQFELVFKNDKTEQLFHIKETADMKTFLRTAYCRINEKQFSQQQNKKQYLLEDILYKKMEEGNYLKDFDAWTDVYYQKSGQKKVQVLKMKSKLICFSKPILVIVIKSTQVIHLIDIYECKLKQYQQAIIDMSNQFVTRQIKVFNETKKIKIASTDSQQIQQVQCLNLSIINSIRNYIIYFQKEKIYHQKKGFLELFNFNNYITTLESYCFHIAKSYQLRFQLVNHANIMVKLQLDIKFLTQVIINLFEWAIENSIKKEIITLSIAEEPNLNSEDKRQMKICQREVLKKEKLELTLLSFTFCFYSKDQIDLVDEEIWNSNFNIKEEFQNLQWAVTNILLEVLGPYNHTKQTQKKIDRVGDCIFINKIKFYIYSDQSQLDISYTKFNHVE